MISFEEFILSDESPIYLQIIRYIKQRISSGEIRNQEEVPSRRVLSAFLGVNPATIQKAYHMLEEEGIIVSRAGAKSYTQVDEVTIGRIRRELLESDTAAWVNAMKQLGVTKEEVYKIVEQLWETR